MRYYALYIDEVNEKLFTYLDADDEFMPGQWVEVVFNNRKKNGFILYELPNKKFEYKVNKISKKVENSIEFNAELVQLFMWMYNYYLANYSDILRVIYPKGVKIRYTTKYYYTGKLIIADLKENELIEYIKQKKEITKATVHKKFKKDTIDRLKSKRIIKEKKVLTNSRSEKLKSQSQVTKIVRDDKLSKKQLEIKKAIEDTDRKYFLIRGVTGSGKTEIYIELLIDCLKQNKGAIFLVPEISITPQMIKKFRAIFKNNIAVLHSKLTDKERAKEWLSVYNGHKKIVVGVRSAIFAPVNNLGLIILDEEHETTYKQDTNPRYHARLVAIKRAEIESCKLVLGSATPSVESYYYAKKNIFKLLEIEERYDNSILPKVDIVDMRKDYGTNFSIELLKAMQNKLSRKEQILILLNKKGFSNYVQCKDCGSVEMCDSCSIAYIYYKSKNYLKCSYCGKIKQFTGKCKKCNSSNISYFGRGTEKLENELEGIFPEAKILRVDSDTVKSRDSYDRIYEDFIDQKYNIIVGTQIISKGLHFPNITLSAIISADSTLNFPDFRAGEKTFQLIVQASGRSGRGEKPGLVKIQTLTPNHYVIERAIKHDYKGFYKQEVAVRKELDYPPFGKIINIIVSSEEEKGLFDVANDFMRKIKIDNIELFGPMEAPIYRIKNRFRFQIFIKGDREHILKIKEKIKENIQDFVSDDVRITVDIDPNNLM